MKNENCNPEESSFFIFVNAKSFVFLMGPNFTSFRLLLLHIIYVWICYIGCFAVFSEEDASMPYSILPGK